jgi:hypothetical protein
MSMDKKESVTRGLDPRVHPRIKSEDAGGAMDARVKPGHDALFERVS